MTLAVYPLVFLPAAASLRNADPAQEEVARSLGLGRLATFWRVTVGQARLAILGGAALVGLAVLAEFGAFEILGFRTLTTEIYTEFTVGFNQPAACALSLVLVVLGGFMVVAARRAEAPTSDFERWLVSKSLSFWIMTWFLAQLVVLTAIGTYFRGPGWSWVWPWRS